MKKLALIAATLICFAGCARNDTGDMTEDTSSTSTGVGTPATSQSETSTSLDTNQPSSITPSSPTLNQDTNNIGQPSPIQSGNPTPTPPPTPEPQPLQQGQQAPPQP
jgi:hypothetical protein